MYQKVLFLVVVTLISILLVSCRETDNAPPPPSPVPVSEAPASTPSPTPEPAMAPTPAPTAYEITGAAYTEGDISIAYPQITGLPDTALQDQINALIEEEATAIAGEGDTIDVSYTVTWQGAYLLSIQYEGIRNTAESAYPNILFYTTNIDMKAGSKVRLADVVMVNENLAEAFKTGQFVPVDSGLLEAEDLIRENISEYDLIGAFAGADNGYGPQNPARCFTYFTPDALGISIGVPHVVGDHAEFEIEYQDVKGNIIANTIWHDLPAIPGE